MSYLSLNERLSPTTSVVMRSLLCKHHVCTRAPTQRILSGNYFVKYLVQIQIAIAIAIIIIVANIIVNIATTQNLYIIIAIIIVIFNISIIFISFIIIMIDLNRNWNYEVLKTDLCSLLVVVHFPLSSYFNLYIYICLISLIFLCLMLCN